MGDIAVTRGQMGYSAVLDGGRRVMIRTTINDLERITSLSIQYPNGTTVDVTQGINGQGVREDGKNTLRIQGMGVTPNMAAGDIRAILTSQNFLNNLIEQGRIDNSGAVTPVGGARAHADAFAAQINPADAVVNPRAPTPAPK